MKKFEKHLEVSSLIIDMLKRAWIVIAVIALIFIIEIALGKLKRPSSPEMISKEEYTTVLINGDYVYSYSMVVNNGTIPAETYISYIISAEVINSVIKEQNLKEAYTDLYSKFTWKIYGDGIQMFFSTPTETAIGGENWVDILTNIRDKSIEKIKEDYPDVTVFIIDPPFLTNAIKKAVVNNNVSSAVVSIKYPLLAGIFSALVILVVYVLNTNIVKPIEIEENMNLPVLAELSKDNVSELVNIMMNNVAEWNSVAFVTLGKNNQGKHVIDQCMDDIRQRFADIKVSTDDSSADIMLTDAGIMGENENATYVSGKCKKTIIIVENNKVNGNKAINAVNNMKMNGANVFGAIYVW